MGNGVSSQGNLPSHDQRDVGSSVTEEQHDWQAEQAVAPKPETLSLQETRKSYICTVLVFTFTDAHAVLTKSKHYSFHVKPFLMQNCVN